MAQPTCLVTGASSGIGSAIAQGLAARGRDVTLVARREPLLKDLAERLSARAGVRTYTVSCDLTDPGDRRRLVERVSEFGLHVETLVNCAGFATAGAFWALPPERELDLVRTNTEALVDLCSTYVPEMVRRGTGHILNVGSIVSFHPSPGTATYAATKAFALSFTQALHGELRGTGVTATALCPGAVRSDFHDVAAGADEATRRRIDAIPAFLWMDGSQVAEAGIDGMMNGRRVVVPGFANRIGVVTLAHAPRGLLLRGIQRFFSFNSCHEAGSHN